jgi:hypothetical protein
MIVTLRVRADFGIEWMAHDETGEPATVFGFGATEAEAIADLKSKTPQ